MKYIKPYAEAVVLNTDIEMKTYSGNASMDDIMAELGNDEYKIRELLGASTVDSLAADAVRFFWGNVINQIHGMTLNEARQHVTDVHESAGCVMIFNAAGLYSADEEDDSFDSEW